MTVEASGTWKRRIAVALTIVVLPAAMLAGLMACGYVDHRDARAAGVNTVQPAAMQAASTPYAPLRISELHVLGDSFAGADGFQRAIERELPDIRITYDDVGGSSLQEQAERFAESPDRWNVPLVILDGGLTDDRPMEEVERIVSMLDTACPVWFYVEPVQTAASRNIPGQPRFERQRTNIAAIRARWPDHFIPLIGPLQRHANAEEQGEVGNGWVPASLRIDRVHLTDRGYAILARQIARRVAAAEASPVCRPPEAGN